MSLSVFTPLPPRSAWKAPWALMWPLCRSWYAVAFDQGGHAEFRGQVPSDSAVTGLTAYWHVLSVPVA